MVPKGSAKEPVGDLHDVDYDEEGIDLENPKYDNFVRDTMDRAYDPITNTIKDIRIDDSKLPLAKNFYDYCKNIYGPGIQMPFSRQMWIMLRALGEMCPHCTKPAAFNKITAIPVDLDVDQMLGPRSRKHITLLENGVCPSCGRTKAGMIMAGELDDITELVLVLGQRSGKSTIIGVATSYITHRLLKLPKISTLTSGIQEFSPLTGVFTAQSTGQAIRVLWKPVRNTILGSAWFQEYHDLLDSISNKKGQELYQINPQGLYIRYFVRNLEFYPSGPGKRSLAGDTRLIAAIDELGLFPFTSDSSDDEEQYDDERERANADEVHQVITNSLLTVRTAVQACYARGISAVPQALLFNASSPKSWKDKICRLLLQSESEPTMFGINLPTWEINPLISRDNPQIALAYRKNPAKAERDWGANPPQVSSDLFDDNIDPYFVHTNAGRVVYQPSDTRTLATFEQTVFADDYPPAILSLDAGETDNAFSLAVVTKSGHFINTPLCIEIVPQPNRKIDFAYTYKHIITPIVKAFNVKFVRADRWQSSFIMDQLEQDFGKDGLKTGKISLRLDDFKAFSSFVDSGQLSLPAIELDKERIMAVRDYKKDLLLYPASHLYLQFRTVQQIKGNFGKGDGYTDDIFRALVVGVMGMMDSKISAHVQSFPHTKRQSRSMRRLISVVPRNRGMAALLP